MQKFMKSLCRPGLYLELHINLGFYINNKGFIAEDNFENISFESWKKAIKKLTRSVAIPLESCNIRKGNERYLNLFFY